MIIFPMEAFHFHPGSDPSFLRSEIGIPAASWTDGRWVFVAKTTDITFDSYQKSSWHGFFEAIYQK